MVVGIEWISNAINTLLGVLNGLIDFIVGVFTGDWNKAWNGIKTVVTSIFNGIKSAITIVLDAIKGTISTIAVAITNKIKSTMEGIKTVFENAWKAIKTIFSDPGQFFSSVWNGIKSAFSHVTDWFRDTFSVAWQAVKDVFSKGGKIFAGIKEGIVSVFKTVVNGLISGINMIISTPFKKINQLLNDIRDTEVLGFTPFDFIPKAPLPIPQIPKLAKGAVIPPRAPFLAMLGDQSSGTNIEAPLETIKQAVREVQNESGSSTSGNDENIIVNVYLEGDADGVFKLIKAEATKFKNRTGKPAFS